MNKIVLNTVKKSKINRFVENSKEIIKKDFNINSNLFCSKDKDKENTEKNRVISKQTIIKEKDQ